MDGFHEEQINVVTPSAERYTLPLNLGADLSIFLNFLQQQCGVDTERPLVLSTRSLELHVTDDLKQKSLTSLNFCLKDTVTISYKDDLESAMVPHAA